METAAQPAQTSAAALPRRGITLPLLAAVLVMLAILTIPRTPTDLVMDPDTSLSAVLSYAHQHGLQFGTDLVFTYGPLGYLTFFYFAPHAALVRMAVDVLFCFTAAAGLCLVAWRGRFVWGLALVAVFVFVTANIEDRADVIMDTGLLCWGLLCFSETGRRLTVSAITFVALAVFGALAKSSVLFMAGPTVVLLAGDLVLRGRAGLGLGMVAGLAAGLVLGWMAAGQALSHLGLHLSNALAIARGYNASLGWEAPLQANTTGLMLIAFATGMVIIRALTAFTGEGRHTGWRRLALLAWISSLLFLNWKHGFVRADSYHLMYFFGFVPVLALALESLPGQEHLARLLGRVLAVVCCILALFTLQTLFFVPGARSLWVPIQSFAYHARCLVRPGDYVQRMSRAIEENRTRARLPVLKQIIGDATVDVFGQSQVYALLNGLNYRPRPVFQGYVAGDARLMRLNERFYLSDAAPEYVLFGLGPIDRRFPPLEDAMVFRDLLVNYDLAGAEDPFLLLKRKSSRPPRLTLVRDGLVRPGERIELGSAARTNLWLEIHVQPTLLGRLRQFFFRPAPVRLAAWRKDAERPLAQRRAPAPMLAAGFVASPLFMRNPDVQAYYTGQDPPRPDAYSVVLVPNERCFWQDAIHYRLYRFSPGDGS